MNMRLLKIVAGLSVGLVVVLSAMLLLQIRPVRAELARISGDDVVQLNKILTTSNSIDVREFWQWRDRTNGHFTFDPETSHIGMTRRLNQPTKEVWPLHIFQSNTISSSTDSLMNATNPIPEILTSLLVQYPDHTYGTLFRGSDFILLENTDTNEKVLIFVKSSAELLTVDGLFDFTEIEQKYVLNQYWVNTTVIR